MKQYNEYYYKIYPNELCNFFRIKYRFWDKIKIEMDCMEGKTCLKLHFKYKKILINQKNVNKFLKKKGYNRFRIYDNCDNTGIRKYIYGVKYIK